MKTLRVLSVDFDFFQNVDKDTLINGYPDGIDLPTGLSIIVWGGKYHSRYKYCNSIKSVEISPMFYEMFDILEKQDTDTPVLISQSHVNIYDFIHTHMEGYDAVSIINVDLHHDLFNDNPELDCGNWLMHISKDFSETTIHWITREVSLECYGIKSDDDLCVEFNLDKIQDAYFDIIFFCRSDAWVPPHLDEYFDEIIQFCSNKFLNVLANKSVLEPRDISAIVEAEERLFEQWEVTKNANNNSVAKQ